ncbi:MAG: cobalamin biosynthesis protein [Pseudomonadota bacterium]
MNSEQALIENSRTALVTLSDEGAALAERLGFVMKNRVVFLHSNVDPRFSGERFYRLFDISENIFESFRNIIFIGPTGIAVRAFGCLASRKTTDPAIVVADVCARYVISLLSGHEGGANELAVFVANRLDAEPVITTTTEARKDLVVGVGCRKGVSSSVIIEAITSTLALERLDLSRVRLLASADIKKDEVGLIEASRLLAIPLRFISSMEINRKHYAFERSDLVYSQFGIPAVAEPTAILAGRRTELIVPKRKSNGVTVAVAKENCT